MLTRYDKFLIIGVLLLAIWLLFIAKYFAKSVEMVTVTIDGRETVRVPLAEDQRFFVDGKLGKSEIEIKDKCVRMLNSPCRNKTCIRTGWIDKSYQTIICAPNGIVISLSGEESDIDGVTR